METKTNNLILFWLLARKYFSAVLAKLLNKHHISPQIAPKMLSGVPFCIPHPPGYVTVVYEMIYIALEL